jgi:hypothetical protein
MPANAKPAQRNRILVRETLKKQIGEVWSWLQHAPDVSFPPSVSQRTHIPSRFHQTVETADNLETTVPLENFLTRQGVVVAGLTRQAISMQLWRKRPVPIKADF